ncbi:glycoside hydrolase superfamily [Globomyces pollinis-pini]|nr:glycoside hydrolase superfamily [Globomyces pollinis-pini]
MGKQYRDFCKTIFCIKAIFALSLSLGVLYRGVSFVKRKYDEAPRILPPIMVPPRDSVDLVKCFHDESAGVSRLQPPGDMFLFGFSLDWAIDTPEQLVSRLGQKPPLINTFVKINATDFESGMIEWQAQLLHNLGMIMELTLEPTVTPQELSDEILEEFAIFMRHINTKYGIPVLLRFMHEMNGNWMPYGMRPVEQIDTWRRMTKFMRRETNMTAMLWSPNFGGGYPYGGMKTLRPDSSDPSMRENFARLDTNNDNRFDHNDDPYGPYYPGDEYVDWIGISVYNYNRYGGQTLPVYPDTFTNLETACSLLKPSFGGYYNFYDRYASGKKPFILSETGSSSVYYGPDTPEQLITVPVTLRNEITSKWSWWNAIFSTSSVSGKGMPNLRAAVWFEEVKLENSYDNGRYMVLRDYRITYNSSVRYAFTHDLKKLGKKIQYAGKFKFFCNGTIHST